MKPLAAARILGTAALGFIVAASGCADGSTGAPVASPAENLSGTLAWSPDPEIVPGDTHYLLDVVQEGSTTYQTTTPVVDPLTGAATTTWTVAHETETQRVEAGYDALGRAIQVLQETTPLYDPTERAVNLSRRTRSVEDVIFSYGPDGGPLQTDYGTAQIARDGIAPSHAQITDGLVLDAEALDTVRVLTADATALASSAGPHARARRPGDDRIEVVNELTPDDFGVRTARGAAMLGTRGVFVRTWRRQGGAYLLERTELVSEWAEERGVRKTERQVNQFRVVRLHRNALRDAERRTRRGVMGKADDVRPRSIGEAPGDNCVVGQDCPDEPPPPPPPPAAECLPVAGGAHLLYQHGINSGGGSFFQLRSWLGCAVAWERAQSSTIDWRRRITQ